MNVRKKTKVLILRTAGTNCDLETAHAFELAKAVTERVHVNRIISGEKKLKNYSIIAIPGGFSYGDDIASGKILANEIRYKFGEAMLDFIKDGRLVIGICNGFQVLVKAGLLPDTKGSGKVIESSLSLNDSAKFEDRWVYLKKNAVKDICVWTKGIDRPVYLPVAHAEGKFIPRSKELLSNLHKNGQVVFTYCDKDGNEAGYPMNPNGSVDGIAGICDTTGRIFGLMPHPERHVVYIQHPFWTRLYDKGEGDGLKIFRNGVEFIRKA
jgi:phosphoribosylformylglycinamidine synthase